MSKSLENDLVRLVGRQRVSVDAVVRREHGGDRWFANCLPDVVVQAGSTEDVRKVMRYADRKSVPVTPRGAGVGYVGGCVPLRGGISLSVSGMQAIREIHVEDGVAVVEPGVITGVLQEEARRRGMF